MKKVLVSAVAGLFLATAAMASGTTKMEEVKKPEKVEAPATPKAMPKVEKPTDKRNLDCTKKENAEKLGCKQKAEADKVEATKTEPAKVGAKPQAAKKEEAKKPEVKKEEAKK
jgi:hypothetical protein